MHLLKRELSQNDFEGSYSFAVLKMVTIGYRVTVECLAHFNEHRKTLLVILFQKKQ